MSCSHGRTESTCIYCATEKTHNLMAKQAAITAASAAEQSAFIQEQRNKANLRETAESVKVQMRHDYLKLVRESKNKMVNLGNGEVKLDGADLELYWAEYREGRFAEIEKQRHTLHDYRQQLSHELNSAVAGIIKTMMGPNIGIAVAAFIIMILSFTTVSNGSQIGPALLMFILLFGGSLGWSIFRNGVPENQNAWIPPLLTALPIGVLGLAMGVASIFGVFLSGVLIFVAKKIRAAAVRRNPGFVNLTNQIASVESQLSELPPHDLMAEIRRLG